MRKLLFIVLLIALFSIPVYSHALSTNAKSAVVIERQTGYVLFDQAADKRMPMASTTKIITALVALEKAPLDTEIIVPKNAVGIEGTSLYLKEGEKISLESLLYGVLLSSANDASVAVAMVVSGSVETFVGEMNLLAEKVGCTQTHFENPHGLDHEEHYTTARELALLTQYAMENPVFSQMVSTKQIRVTSEIPLEEASDDGALFENYTRLLINHHRLVKNNDCFIGGKTGFTKRCGRCLVSVFEEEGKNLIIVTLSDPDDWRDHTNLAESLAKQLKKYTLLEENELILSCPVFGASRGEFKAINALPLTVMLPENITITKKVVLYPCNAPISEGQVVGEVSFWVEDKEIEKSPIIATENVAPYTPPKKFFGLF